MPHGESEPTFRVELIGADVVVTRVDDDRQPPNSSSADSQAKSKHKKRNIREHCDRRGGESGPSARNNHGLLAPLTEGQARDKLYALPTGARQRGSTAFRDAGGDWSAASWAERYQACLRPNDDAGGDPSPRASRSRRVRSPATPPPSFRRSGRGLAGPTQPAPRWGTQLAGAVTTATNVGTTPAARRADAGGPTETARAGRQPAHISPASSSLVPSASVAAPASSPLTDGRRGCEDNAAAAAPLLSDKEQEQQDRRREFAALEKLALLLGCRWSSSPGPMVKFLIQQTPHTSFTSGGAFRPKSHFFRRRQRPHTACGGDAHPKERAAGAADGAGASRRIVGKEVEADEDKDDGDGSDPFCAICQSSFGTSVGEWAVETPCGHQFCFGCIQSWFDCDTGYIRKKAKVCPCCRSEINESSAQALKPVGSFWALGFHMTALLLNVDPQALVAAAQAPAVGFGAPGVPGPGSGTAAAAAAASQTELHNAVEAAFEAVLFSPGGGGDDVAVAEAILAPHRRRIAKITSGSAIARGRAASNADRGGERLSQRQRQPQRSLAYQKQAKSPGRANGNEHRAQLILPKKTRVFQKPQPRASMAENPLPAIRGGHSAGFGGIGALPTQPVVAASSA